MSNLDRPVRLPNGRKRDRTSDTRLIKTVLYQLSYAPERDPVVEKFEVGGILLEKIERR